MSEDILKKIASFNNGCMSDEDYKTDLLNEFPILKVVKTIITWINYFIEIAIIYCFFNWFLTSIFNIQPITFLKSFGLAMIMNVCNLGNNMTNLFMITYFQIKEEQQISGSKILSNIGLVLIPIRTIILLCTWGIGYLVYLICF